MKNIINEAPGVAEAFRNLTNAIDENSVLDLKTKSLILIGIFTANKTPRPVGTHVERALKYGATKDEIVCAILYALPAVGIPAVTIALDKALETINN